MPLYNENVAVTNEIISYVRSTILHQMTSNPDMDPWNEDEDGAAWLDNELSLATDLLVKIKEVDPIDWSIYHSVNEVKRRLVMMPINDLRFIKHVVVTHGGTQHSYHFDLRDEEPVNVRAYFKISKQ